MLYMTTSVSKPSGQRTVPVLESLPLGLGGCSCSVHRRSVTLRLLPIRLSSLTCSGQRGAVTRRLAVPLRNRACIRSGYHIPRDGRDRRCRRKISLLSCEGYSMLFLESDRPYLYLTGPAVS